MNIQDLVDRQMAVVSSALQTFCLFSFFLSLSLSLSLSFYISGVLYHLNTMTSRMRSKPSQPYPL